MPDVNAFLQPALYTPAMAQQNALQAKKLKNENAMFDMEVADREAARAEAEAGNAMLSQAGGDYNKAAELAKQAGKYGLAQSFQKNVYDMSKLEGESQKNIAQANKYKADEKFRTLEATGKKLAIGSQLAGSATPETWAQIRQQGIDAEIWTADQVPEEYNPQLLKTMANQALTAKDKVDMEMDRLANERAERNTQSLIESRNRPDGGGDISKGWEVKDTPQGMVRVNKYTGEVAPIVTQDGAPVVGKTATTSKPMPAGIIKQQQEEVEIVKGTEDINRTLDKYYNDIKNGDLKLGLGKSIRAGVARETGMLSDENTTKLNNFKSDITKMVNASLRLNKGVQTEGDAQRTAQEILSNINDPDYVKERLKILQGYNEAAAKAKREVIDLTRAEYGKEPLFGAQQTSNQGAGNQGAQDDISALLEKYK